MWTFVFSRNLLKSLCNSNLKQVHSIFKACNEFSILSCVSYKYNDDTLLQSFKTNRQEIKQENRHRRKKNNKLAEVIVNNKYLLDTYGWILRMKEDVLNEKVEHISKMNFEETLHSLPFYEISTKNLATLAITIKLDSEEYNCKNRLYYLSEKLKYDPAILSGYLSKKLFVYKMSFEWLQNSLNTLLDMGVRPDCIVKDLWVLKYNHKTIKTRLDLVKASKRFDLMPWMVRCPENVLNRSLDIANTEKSILGNYTSTQDYLAERLKITPQIVDILCKKVPSIRNIRVLKAKNYLDFLFSRGYTEEDILCVPRILAHSLNTIQSRLTKLETVGIKNPKNLNIVCKTNKDFDIYFKNVSSNKSAEDGDPQVGTWKGPETCHTEFNE